MYEPIPTLPLQLQPDDFILSGVSLESCIYKHYPALRMTMPVEAIQDPTKDILADGNFMAWLPVNFREGEVDVWVASELIPYEPTHARGFVGLSFRIDQRGQFESIYLRPTNSMSDDQIRRNHSVQYVAFPDFRFDRLRRESPEKYETYAELDLERWIHMRIVVTGQRAVLFLDNKERPALIVNDLKLGIYQCGGVGIWLESGTVAYFRNLSIRT